MGYKLNVHGNSLFGRFIFSRARINVKGFVHHTPTDDDITNIMTEFTLDILLNGYRYLVKDLLAKLSSDKEMVRLHLIGKLIIY